MSYYGASEPQTNMDAGKIFVGGLSWQTTEETLRYHFEQYGEVSSVEVMRDRNTGDPRGFAFVVFKSDETVELVMGSGPHEINNKIVDVKRAQARWALHVQNDIIVCWFGSGLYSHWSLITFF